MYFDNNAIINFVMLYQNSGTLPPCSVIWWTRI